MSEYSYNPIEEEGDVLADADADGEHQGAEGPVNQLSPGLGLGQSKSPKKQLLQAFKSQLSAGHRPS